MLTHTTVMTVTVKRTHFCEENRATLDNQAMELIQDYGLVRKGRSKGGKNMVEG